MYTVVHWLIFMFIDYFTQALEYRSLLGGSIVAPNPLINRYPYSKKLKEDFIRFLSAKGDAKLSITEIK